LPCRRRIKAICSIPIPENPFPEKTVEALHCLIPGLEGGPSDVLIDRDTYQQEFRDIVMSIALGKGIVVP